MKELLAIQGALSVPKDRKAEGYKSDGSRTIKYKYRSCEDILGELKPILSDQECTIILRDAIQVIGERYYLKATAILSNKGGESVECAAFARETEKKVSKSGAEMMDRAQITGAASSYARKYALCGLFAIDTGDDINSQEKVSYEQKNKPKSVKSQHEKNEDLIIATKELEKCKTRKEVANVWKTYSYLQSEPIFKDASQKRTNEIKDANKNGQ